MNITELFQLVPGWLKTSVSILAIIGSVWWYMFRHWLKMNKVLNRLKDATYQDIIEIVENLREENKTLREKVSELQTQLLNNGNEPRDT